MPLLRNFSVIAALVILAAATGAPPAEPDTSGAESDNVRLWTGPGVNMLGAPSRDGRWLSVVDGASGDLAVRELTTGHVQRVTDKHRDGERDEFAYFSVMSDDGAQVAYAWFNEEGFYELRLADVPGRGEPIGRPRTLYRNSEAGFVQPCAFTPDGKQILTLFFRRDNISQIALVSVADGSVTTLKSLSWIYPKQMDISPDGSSIVYDNLSSTGAHERDIFLLAVDGSHETRLLSGDSNDLFPLWAPGGDAVLFSSDRGGSPGLWALPIEHGRPAAEPALIKSGLGRFLPLGVTERGELLYGVRSGGTALRVAEAEGGAERPLWSDSETDKFSPAYSPDGSAMAYLVRVSSENHGQPHRAVVVRTLPDGAELGAPTRMAHVEIVSWSPSGDRLLLQGSDRRGRAGLFVFDIASGKTAAVIVDASAGFRGIPGTFDSTGENVLYVRQGPSTELTSRSLGSGEDIMLHQASVSARIHLLALSKKGTELAFAVDAGRPAIFVLNLSAGAARKILELPAGEVTGLAWATEKDQLLVGTHGTTGALLWQVGAAGDVMRQMESPRDRLPGLTVNPVTGDVAYAVGGTTEEVWLLRNAAEPLE